ALERIENETVPYPGLPERTWVRRGRPRPFRRAPRLCFAGAEQILDTALERRRQRHGDGNGRYDPTGLDRADRGSREARDTGHLVLRPISADAVFPDLR